MTNSIELLIENHPMYSEQGSDFSECIYDIEDWEKLNSDYAFLTKLNLALFLELEAKGYDDEAAHKIVLESN